MGLSIGQILIVGIIANIAGAFGCYLIGAIFKDDKKTVIMTLLMLSLIVTVISINKDPKAFMLLTVAGTFCRTPAKL